MLGWLVGPWKPVGTVIVGTLTLETGFVGEKTAVDVAVSTVAVSRAMYME
jgi:hypothetical protein